MNKGLGKKDIKPDGLECGFWDRIVHRNLLRIRNYTCETCGKRDTRKHMIHIHHIRYDVLTIKTLQVLCNSCHKFESNRLKKVESRFQDFDVFWTCFITNPNRILPKSESECVYRSL